MQGLDLPTPAWAQGLSDDDLVAMLLNESAKLGSMASSARALAGGTAPKGATAQTGQLGGGDAYQQLREES